MFHLEIVSGIEISRQVSYKLCAAMTNLSDNNAFFAALRALIEKWCDRRSLIALNYILGPYLAFNDLTDGWADLRVGLQNVRAFARTELKPDELEELDELIRVVNKAISRS
jgi:hypothetical protein